MIQYKIVMGSDHVGYKMKNELRDLLETMGHIVEDVGCFNESRAEYPIYGRKAAEKVATGQADRAVLVCGTGFGISLAANSVHGVRCVNCIDAYTASLSRMHNNANAIAFGARVIAPEMAKMLLETWMHTEFEGGRHADRIEMIQEMCAFPRPGEYTAKVDAS